jgi:hypothetical protein
VYSVSESASLASLTTSELSEPANLMSLASLARALLLPPLLLQRLQLLRR